MNFYISSFSKRFGFGIALVTAAFSLILVDALIYFYVVGKTTKEHFIDNKDSKFLHLSHQDSSEEFDVIFIGSSYTKNHISSAYFLSQGKRVYNLGISGRLLGDFPSMVTAASKSNPKLIVLSISDEELFETPKSEFVHWDDLGPLLASQYTLASMAQTVGIYGLSLHALHYYREPVYQQLRSKLAWLVPPPQLLIQGSSIGDAVVSDVLDQERRGADCVVFKTAVYDRMKVLTCTNGDGIQLGRVAVTSQRPEQVTFRPNAIDEGAVAFLNRVIGIANSHARVVVVLQPKWRVSPRFSVTDIESRIHAPIIDLRGNTFTDQDWCDDSHFNLFGRAKYSELMEKRLHPFFVLPFR